MSRPNWMLRFAKPNSLVFPNRTALDKEKLEPWSFNRLSPPLSLSTKKSWGGLWKASLIIFILFATLFSIIMSVRQRRGIKRRRVRGGCTGHATIIKAETIEACIAVPLLHQSLYIKASNPFFKWLNFQAFFSRQWESEGLQIQVSMNFLHWLGAFLPCTPLTLSLHIGCVLGHSNPKEPAKNLLNRGWRLISLLPLPLAALGGEEPRVVTALLSSTGALRSFLIRKGWCSLSQPTVQLVTLSIICIR
jgi:hypothetical protein